MTTNAVPTPPPNALRLLRSPAALELAELVATFEDLQMVLRCCERLVSALADGNGAKDDVLVESVWTVALLSYARCFSAGGGAAVTEADLRATQPHGDVLDWHTVLLQLRDHYADPTLNPRERFSIGVAQNEEGAAKGLAVTSARQPLVDTLTVKQTGAIAFALSTLVNDRITAQQEKVFAEVRDTSTVDLDKLPCLDLAEPE